MIMVFSQNQWKHTELKQKERTKPSGKKKGKKKPDEEGTSGAAKERAEGR
jgi:hypothetical protein